MYESSRKPELIVIAGPNGSGKTTMTQQFLHHEWTEGIVYINPDQVAKDIFGGDARAVDSYFAELSNASPVVLCQCYF